MSKAKSPASEPLNGIFDKLKRRSGPISSRGNHVSEYERLRQRWNLWEGGPCWRISCGIELDEIWSIMICGTWSRFSSCVLLTWLNWLCMPVRRTAVGTSEVEPRSTRWTSTRPSGPGGAPTWKVVFFYLVTFSKLVCLDFVSFHFLNLCTMPTSISLDHNRLSCRCTCFRSQKEEKTKTVVQVTSWFWISDWTNLPPELTLEAGGLPRAGLALWPGSAPPGTPSPRPFDPRSGSSQAGGAPWSPEVGTVCST